MTPLSLHDYYNGIVKPTTNLSVVLSRFQYELEIMISMFPLDSDFIHIHRQDVYEYWGSFMIAIDRAERKGVVTHSKGWKDAFLNLEQEVATTRIQKLSVDPDSYWIAVLCSDDLFKKTITGFYFSYLNAVHYENIEPSTWSQYCAPNQLSRLLPINAVPPIQCDLHTDGWNAMGVNDEAMGLYAYCWHKYHGVDVYNEAVFLASLPDTLRTLCELGAYADVWQTFIHPEHVCIYPEEIPLVL